MLHSGTGSPDDQDDSDYDDDDNYDDDIDDDNCDDSDDDELDENTLSIQESAEWPRRRKTKKEHAALAAI